jgi:hypothetical protein
MNGFCVLFLLKVAAELLKQLNASLIIVANEIASRDNIQSKKLSAVLHSIFAQIRPWQSQLSIPMFARLYTCTVGKWALRQPVFPIIIRQR